MADEFKVSKNLVAGNKFIKWEDESPTVMAVNLFVDSKGYLLYWSDQHREMDYIDMSLIIDVRTGNSARVPKDPKLRESLKIGQQDISLQDKMLTICYGTDLSSPSFVNFTCLSADIAKEWCSEIFKCCHSNRSPLTLGPLDHLEKCFLKLSLVRDTDGKIPIKNIVKMFTQNNKEDKKKIINALEASKLITNQTDSLDSLTFDEFFSFYQNLCFRMDVADIFYNIRSSSGEAYLSQEHLVHFLNTEQRDPRLNELLYPRCTSDRALSIINKYEPDVALSTEGKMSRQGFLKFLLSSDNNIVSRVHSTVNQDMNRPLSHYFINSSHNTYLTGHQLTSRSSVEMYRQTLLAGCRCVEIDCWDGSDDEPVVTHGFTVCTEILLKDVLEAISEAAFKTSDWPVLLSFENHCSPKQQTKIAHYCRTVFGEHLLESPLTGHPLEPGVSLPSPEQLRRKILIKNKKHHPHSSRHGNHSNNNGGSSQEKMKVKKTLSSQSRDSCPPSPLVQGSNNPVTLVRNESETDSDNEGEENLLKIPDKFMSKLQTANAEKGTAAQESSAVSEISDLVIYVQPARFVSFEVCQNKNRSYECTSFVESQALVLLNAFPVEFVNYNKAQLCRIYPRGTRVDSSNFIPQIFWNAGCQLVSLNFQTLDLAMQLNLGAFEFNGRSGYLLKPDILTLKERSFDPFSELSIDGIVQVTLTVKIISGQFLSDKKVSTYVAVDLLGLPTDTVRTRFRTRVCTSNSLNPVFNEDPFVFKQILLPHLAQLRLTAYNENGNLLGQRVLPLEYLRPGYRHISLCNERCQPQGMATLFVHITLKDFIPDFHAEIAEALTNPIAYQSHLLEIMERHAHQLEVLEGDFEPSQVDNQAAETSPLNWSQTNQEDIWTYAPNHKSKGMTLDLRKSSYSNYEGRDLPRRAFTTGALKSSCSETNLNLITDDPKSGLHMSSSLLVPSNRYRLHRNSDELKDTFCLPVISLSDLRGNKRHLKVLAKINKEFSNLKKKHEKELYQKFSQYQQEIKRLSKELKSKDPSRKTSAISTESQIEMTKNLQSSNLLSLCFEQEKAELQFQLQREEKIFESLRKVIEETKELQVLELEKRHAKGVGSLKKRHGLHIWEEMKLLRDKHKDKNELSRVRRESMQKNINSAVKERMKLSEMFDCQISLITSRQEELLHLLTIEKEKAEQQLRESFARKFNNTFAKDKTPVASPNRSHFKIIEETRL